MLKFSTYIAMLAEGVVNPIMAKDRDVRTLDYALSKIDKLDEDEKVKLTRRVKDVYSKYVPIIKKAKTKFEVILKKKCQG